MMTVFHARPVYAEEGFVTIHRVLPIALLASLLAPAAVAGEAHAEITVYAAASLRDVLEEVAHRCESAAGARLVFSFGASSVLALQIEAAPKADVFFSADEAWMDALTKDGLVDAASRRSPLSNRLVVVGPRDGTLRARSAADLERGGLTHLCLADPRGVPAGKYAKAWLTRTGSWDRLESRIVPALDVRAALAAVEAGACEAGVVYRTDAAISKKTKVLFEVPDAESPMISYALAAISGRRGLETARKVVACLSGPEAGEIYARHGFLVKPGKP
jgi:molybdate transport system substrate-binding protein